MYVNFHEIFVGIMVVMAFGFFFGDMVNDMRDGQNTFKILDGCEDFKTSCTTITNTLIDENSELNRQLDIKKFELKAKDNELKSEAFIQTAKVRNIRESLFILIIAIIFGCYLLLDKYFNLKKEYLKALHVKSKAKTKNKDVKKDEYEKDAK